PSATLATQWCEALVAVVRSDLTSVGASPWSSGTGTPHCAAHRTLRRTPHETQGRDVSLRGDVFRFRSGQPKPRQVVLRTVSAGLTLGWCLLARPHKIDCTSADSPPPSDFQGSVRSQRLDLSRCRPGRLRCQTGVVDTRGDL